MTFLALQELTAADLNDRFVALEDEQAARGLKARIQRTSNSSSTSGTTELAVLRGDGITCTSGRAYKFSFAGRVQSTVNGDGFRVRLRLQTDGTNATTSSTEVASCPVQSISSQGSGFASVQYLHCPGANQTVSVLLTLVRVTGTGTLQIETVNSLIQILVEDVGVAPATSGTAL